MALENMSEAVKALAVLALTPQTRRWLIANDPKALEQADAAIEPLAPEELARARENAAAGVRNAPGPVEGSVEYRNMQSVAKEYAEKLKAAEELKEALLKDCKRATDEAEKRGAEIETLRKDCAELSRQRDLLKDKLGDERATHERERQELQGKLDASARRQRARAKYIRALEALARAADQLKRVFDDTPAGVLGTLGGHPEYIDTYEGFAYEMAEWAREQAMEWLDPEPEDDDVLMPRDLGKE